MIRIIIDADRCVGAGNCVFWAPHTFDLDDDAKSVVVDPSGDGEDRIRVAADGCPAGAITVESVAAGESATAGESAEAAESAETRKATATPAPVED